MTTYQPTLSAALAHEHLTELLRQAATSRAAAQAPDQNPHRTPRRRHRGGSTSSHGGPPLASPSPRTSTRSRAAKGVTGMRQQQITRRATRIGRGAPRPAHPVRTPAALLTRGGRPRA